MHSEPLLLLIVVVLLTGVLLQLKFFLFSASECLLTFMFLAGLCLDLLMHMSDLVKFGACSVLELGKDVLLHPLLLIILRQDLPGVELAR